jgi:hypothetical protein
MPGVLQVQPALLMQPSGVLCHALLNACLSA